MIRRRPFAAQLLGWCAFALACPALAQPGKVHVPPGQIADIARGRARTLIVVLADRDIEDEAARGRRARGLVHDDEGILQEKARRYGELKRRVRSAPGLEAADVRKEYSHLPMLALRIRNAAALEALARRPEVIAIHPDAEERAFLAQSLPLVRQPQAYAAGHAGASATVAVLDTGVNYARAEFGSCTSPGVPAGCKVAAAVEIAPDDGALDADGHGTNVAAIVLGVAPAARVVALDVFTGEIASMSDVLDGLNWVLANRAAYNIVAVNMSLGSGKYTSPVTSSPYATPLANLRSAGVVPVAASGNDGYTDGIAQPAAVTGAVSVGAVYDSAIGTYSGSCTDSATAADRVSCFSNSASFLSLLAPGAFVYAGGYSMAGTSQASPHVAGAAAVLRAAFPGESVDLIVSRLLSAATVVDYRNGIAKPRLDLAAAAGLSAGFSTAAYHPLSDGASWNLRKDGASGYTETVTGTQMFNGSPTKVVARSPEGDQAYITNDASGVRQHGYFTPSVFVEGCGNVAETDTYSPPVTFVMPNGYVGQSISASGSVTIDLAGCATVPYTYSGTTTIEAFETTTVPAGVFLTLRVRLNYSFYYQGTLQQTNSSVYWLARDVGAVKSQQTTGGVTETEELESTSLARTAPDPFTLGGLEGVSPGSVQTSPAITIAGITAPAAIAVTTGEYSVNGGSWTSGSGSVTNGQTVRVRLTAPATYSTALSAILTVGGVSDAFTVTTQAAPDTVPDAFAFTPVSNAPRGVLVTSNAITVTGIAAPAPISVAGGSYSVNGGAFTTTAASVSAGDTVRVQVLAASAARATTQATLTIGGASAAFSVTTAGVVKNDFGGDGKSDVLWRNSGSGENYIYPMDGTSILAAEGYIRAVADQNWQVKGAGDFNGDGKSDILWRNSVTGQNYIYFMDGTTILPAEGYIRAVADQNWQPIAIGDFDGDGKDDILWRNAVTGENYIYFMDGLTIKPAEGYIRTVADLNWHVEGAGDFDGDGKADILWRNWSTGENYLYPMNGLTILGTERYLRTVADLNWGIAGIGDFNGDGKADIFWRNGTTGENYLYPMNGTTILPSEGYIRTVADQNWQVRGTGDYDGDGKSDLLWRNSSTGENYLYPLDGITIKPTEGYLRTVPAGGWSIIGR